MSLSAKVISLLILLLTSFFVLAATQLPNSDGTFSTYVPPGSQSSSVADCYGYVNPDIYYCYSVPHPNYGSDGYTQTMYARQSTACNDGWHYESGLCSDTQPETPETCKENGTFWDKGQGFCVTSCPNGYLDHYCLAPEPPEGCTFESADYKGVFNGVPYCDSNLPESPTCADGTSHFVENPDGSFGLACGIAPESPEEAGDAETTETSTVTEGDITTITTINNTTGETTITTTNNATGVSTTTNNYAGVDSQTGEPCTAESEYCYPTPDTQKGVCKGSTLCDDVSEIKDIMKGEGLPDRQPGQGEFDSEGAQSEVQQAETELNTVVNDIKGQISGYFDLSLSGSALACAEGVQVLGITLQICPEIYKDELVILAQLVMLLAAMISLFIILR